LGAEVINRWLSDAETDELLARYDAMACSHVEASQSGVAALAFGNCMPVIATPVGGLSEQVIFGRTGVLAAAATPQAFADAVHQLVTIPNLYDQISAQLMQTREQRSMHKFLTELVELQRVQ
jgi:glycosyltransferase involved in cell wall biosynthesis